MDSNYFDDVDIRVNIDWNGDEFNPADPNSELDVMATKNSRIISVSCKSGKYDQQDIYEVKANAVKFGGQYANAVLCVDLAKNREELVKKGKELEVLIVEYKEMRKREFAKILIDWLEGQEKNV